MWSNWQDQGRFLLQYENHNTTLWERNNNLTNISQFSVLPFFLSPGTELRNNFLHDRAISTPKGLKATLEDPYTRQHYVIDADLKSATMDSIYNAEVKLDRAGNVILSPVGGRRRIDFVLYHKDCSQVTNNIIL